MAFFARNRSQHQWLTTCRHTHAWLRVPALGCNCRSQCQIPLCAAHKLARFAGSGGALVQEYVSRAGHSLRSDRRPEAASSPHLPSQAGSFLGRIPATQATGAEQKRATQPYGRKTGSSQAPDDGSFSRNRIFLRSRLAARIGTLGASTPGAASPLANSPAQPVPFTTASTSNQMQSCQRFSC